MKVIACDLETEGLEARYNPDCKIHCVVLRGAINLESEWCPEIKKHISNLAQTHKFVFHNASFDVNVLHVNGVEIPHYDCTMLMAYCLFPSERMSLDALSKLYLDKSKFDKPSFDTFTQEMLEYCIQDTELTLELHHELSQELHLWPYAEEFYNKIELPYSRIIMEMERTGAHIDPVKLKETGQLMLDTYNEAAAQLYKIPEVRAGIPRSKSSYTKIAEREATALGIARRTERFNPDAPRHVGHILEARGHELPVSDKGNKQTNKDVLNLFPDDKFVQQLQHYRKYAIIHNTFMPAVLNNRHNGRLHGSFNQARVRTGRLSCSEPNLQNVPSRDERGGAMRRMFAAEPGNILLVGDLDRIEMVVLGFYLEWYLSYSKLNDRLKAGEDVHTSNALEWSEIAGVEIPRKKAKNGGFALNYGCGQKKFANTVGCSVEAAKKIFAKSKYIAAVMELRDMLIEECKEEKGVLSNFFGRNLYIPEIMSKDRSRYSVGMRLVLNYAIQSTAGDVFKYLQLKAKKNLPPEIQQLIVVHDECIYEAPAEMYDYRHVLSETYTTNELLVIDDVWAPVSCKFFAAPNWWCGKVAEDVLKGEHDLVTPEELETIKAWNIT